MFCPSCGQRQISNQTKFCSRCGIPLGLISEVVLNGGTLPQLAELNAKKKPLLSRRNGLGFSLIWTLFFLLIMAPFWGIVRVRELAGISAVLGIFGGLIMMLSSFIFLKKDAVRLMFDQSGFPAAGQPELRGQTEYQSLPPQQSVPASVYAAPQTGSWRDTNDLIPSVTEGTTKLLEKDENP